MRVNKSKWERPNFGKIGDFFSGYTPKSEEVLSSGETPYFKVAEMNLPGNEIFLHKTSLFVDNSHKCFPKETIVFPKNGAAVSTNKKRILMQPSVVDLNTAGIKVHDFCIYKYAFYWISFIDFKNLIRRGAVPTLNLTELKSLSFPLPDIRTQTIIVNELDAIQTTIDGYREQLADLDRLAQSIFLDTFGDPISNPKGWEVIKLGDACKLKAGKSIKASELSSSLSKDLFPCYGGNGLRGYLNRFSHDGLYTIIGRQGALCGNVKLVKGKFYATEHAVVVTPQVSLHQVWLYYTLCMLNLNSYATGVAQPGLSVTNILPIDLPFPPIVLQQQFAEQVEAIERQKELLRQQIADAETLMAERMQYYFSETSEHSETSEISDYTNKK